MIKDKIDLLAFKWLRKTHPNGVTVMRTRGEQEMLKNYPALESTERS